MGTVTLVLGLLQEVYAWRYIICFERGGCDFGFGMNLTAYLDWGIMDWELCIAYYRLRMWMWMWMDRIG